MNLPVQRACFAMSAERLFNPWATRAVCGACDAFGRIKFYLSCNSRFDGSGNEVSFWLID